MNEQEQRAAIAGVCGWTRLSDGRDGWKSPLGNVCSNDGFMRLAPDYLNDLNAMHEAEKVLDRNQKNRYLNILHEICLPDDYDELDDDFNWCIATAAQRAEAFLKALNLWTE